MHPRSRSRLLGTLAAVLGASAALALPGPAPAQAETQVETQVDTAVYQALEWRLVGPFRGGRVTAVAGHPDRPETFFMGATGGGVWRTTNAGASWENVSDGYFGSGSVGAITVAPSDPDLVYVGMGEEAIRGVTTAHGDGLYRSVDGGDTWTHLGLEDTRHIADIRIHPENPDLLWLAAQGNPWGPSEARGVYVSTDGGETWERTLYVNETTGASGLALDPNRPHVVYAALWDHIRRPWTVRSGGPGSGLYRSTDGGRTWTEMTNGLPDLMGNTDIAVSPVDSDRLYAMIEAEEGGVYRSDDAGGSWRRVNSNPGIRDRGWYYTNVYAHPTDRETVFVLAAPMTRSIDGGHTFEEVDTPHGDNHDLWINPERPEVMVEGNDGGANVTNDAGRTWTTQFNQPTAQFYRVITDDVFPYRLYAGQQDNSTVRIQNRSMGGGIGQQHWEAIGGGESAHVGFDADDPTLVYATSILGSLTEYDTRTGRVRDISPYPYFAGFRPADELNYRFNWNAPVVVSQHDPSVIYHAAQVVLRSTDRGRSWTEASPDLTRADTSKMGTTGGPVMIEGAGGEHYGTIMYLAESPHDPDVLWAGSDDGLVHVTRDGGGSWEDVTPEGMPETQVNAIDISPHDPGAAYIAATSYKLDDFSPMIYRTDDYGASWTPIAAGIPDDGGHFVRVVREDPVREGLLYAGTEGGVFVSFDDGASWQSLQLNLPIVPITDLRIQDDDLVAATQGRSFWILDGLQPLRQAGPEVEAADVHLFEPAEALLLDRRREGAPGPGDNPPGGAVLHYTLSEEAARSDRPLSIEIVDAAGEVVREFTDAGQEAGTRRSLVKGAGGAGPERPLPRRAGGNRYVWNLAVEDFVPVGDTIRYVGNRPYTVAPGEYEVRLTLGDRTLTRPLTVGVSPNADEYPADAWREQQELARRLYDLVNDVHRTTNRLRSAGQQARRIVELSEGLPGAAAAAERAEALVAAVRDWQEQVPQPPLPEGREDRVAYPSRLLSTQVLHVLGIVDDGPPVSEQVRERVDALEDRWGEIEEEARRIVEGELAALEAVLAEHELGGVILPSGDRVASRLEPSE